jgi:hypothetical protein
MEASLQQHVAFYLTGRIRSPELLPIEGLALRPALFARYRDLSGLRHDYPVILVEDAEGESSVLSLSGFFDVIAAAAGEKTDPLRVQTHAERIEREIRKAVFSGASGRLSALWDEAERSLSAQVDGPWQDSIARLRTARAIDGEVVGCDRELPFRLVTHVWTSVQAAKTARERAVIDRLVLKLGDILRADDANSPGALRAGRLAASVGASFAGDIDFAKMSQLLTAARPAARLPAVRRARIERLLAILRTQGFFPAPGVAETPPAGTPAYRFVFETIDEALAAFRDRLPRMVDLAKAMSAAGLEIDGRYREATHDAMFDAIGAEELGRAELARFPDYLVRVHAEAMTAADGANLMEAISAGLPIKVLLTTDDLAAPLQVSDGHPSTGVRVRRLAHAAMGLCDVFVLQASSSHLYQLRGSVSHGLAFAGPAFFSIYSGVSGEARGIPPYLAAAAATESRVFPSFVYDPAAGDDWASRLSLAGNPQPERDWPVHRFEWEGESLLLSSADLAFTPVEFLACDDRYARHFARVPKTAWNGAMVPVPEMAAEDRQGLPERVPYTLLVDGEDRVHRAIVDEKLVREARHMRELWRSLQELGGVRNSHAERLLASERKIWEARAASGEEARGAAAPEAPMAENGSVAAAEPAVAEPAVKPNSDEPYIETPRCSSCNECVHINDRMFKYNQNKQAYIADPTAGTFAQLVEAAESCQVAIIHPGKPKNAAESNLEALLERAREFA